MDTKMVPQMFPKVLPHADLAVSVLTTCITLAEGHWAIVPPAWPHPSMNPRFNEIPNMGLILTPNACALDELRFAAEALCNRNDNNRRAYLGWVADGLALDWVHPVAR